MPVIFQKKKKKKKMTSSYYQPYVSTFHTYEILHNILVKIDYSKNFTKLLCKSIHLSFSSAFQRYIIVKLGYNRYKNKKKNPIYSGRVRYRGG